MGWAEFHHWMAYRAKYGPLHQQQRLVDGVALLATAVSNTVPRKAAAQFNDFLLYQVAEPISEAVIDLETAIATWR